MARAKKSRIARKVRGLSDELGLTTPKTAQRRRRKRASASAPRGPRKP